MSDRLATLLPSPARVRALPGRFGIGRDTTVIAGPGARDAAEAVRRVLTTLPWPQQQATAPGETRVSIEPARPPEGYRLRISPDWIDIAAADPAGAFYAAQVVRQLLPDEAWRTAPVPGPAWDLPCAEIEDAPALRWRGGHLDVARHFFPKRTVLSFIDMLAAHKLNRLHLHLTDDQGWRVESHRHPALQQVASHRPQTLTGPLHARPAAYDGTPHGGYYTLDDLAEIAAYARQRMIKLVPEVEVPGHASALLAALPELAPDSGRRYRVITEWGVFPQIVAPLPATLGVLEDIFGELLGAVPVDFVHIGGDECVLDHWRASPRVEEYRRALDLPDHEALYAYFLRRVEDMLADRFGVRAVVWDEGFAGSVKDHEQTRPREDTIVMAWRGDDIALRAALAGHEVIQTPVASTYFDISQADDDDEPLARPGPVTIEDVAALCPVPAGWPDQAARRVLGTQFQVWTEYIPDARALDYMTFPRACVLADVAWHGRPARWAELSPRLAAHLGRLSAAGIEYRPLAGPHPWQRAGTGARRHPQPEQTGGSRR